MQLKEPEYKYDISFVMPSMNEGENIKKIMDEMIVELNRLGLVWEIIAIDTPSKNPSFQYLKEYAEKFHNITAISLNEKRKAGSGKTFQYMLGFDLAKGRLIGQIDTDGQDNPKDLTLFLDKINDGYDLVVGYKQKRKDGGFYMFTSKISNFMNRMLSGVTLHDMNCGFKVYRSHAAKSLNLKGRWYRFIPSILNAKGFHVTEVPIENRKREHGKSNFSFLNRLQGGVFDLLVVSILNKYGDVPMYFWGWLSFWLGISFLVLMLAGFLTIGPFTMPPIYVFSGAFLTSAIVAFMFGIMIEFRRYDEPFKWEQKDIREFYRKPRSDN